MIIIGDEYNKARRIETLYCGNANNKARRIVEVYAGAANNTARKVYPLLEENIVLECFDYKLVNDNTYNFPAIVLTAIYYTTWLSIFGDYRIEIPSYFGDYKTVIDAEFQYVK